MIQGGPVMPMHKKLSRTRSLPVLPSESQAARKESPQDARCAATRRALIIRLVNSTAQGSGSPRLPREHTVMGAGDNVIGTSRHSERDVASRIPHWKSFDWAEQPPNLVEKTGLRTLEVSPWLDPGERIVMVTAHGTPDHFYAVRNDGSKMPLTGTQLGALLHVSDTAYAQFTSENPGGAIFLVSCHTGYKIDGVAQKLATATGRRVYAPAGEAGFGRAKTASGARTISSTPGPWRVFEPDPSGDLSGGPSAWLDAASSEPFRVR